MSPKNLCILAVFFVFFNIALIGCSKAEIDASVEKSPALSENKAVEEEDESIVERDKNQLDYDLVKPNEAGKIMILMYHNISNKESTWSRNYENFKKDLQILYEKKYRLIGMKDLIKNNIDIPAGYTPVIITFDDGLLGQFRIVSKGEQKQIDENCAVKIMYDFYKQHPNFGLKGVFYLNTYPTPFGQREYIKEKLEFLVNNGLEIGNHTYSHENLSKISEAEISKQIGKNIIELKKYLPEYEIDSLALPYGGIPGNLDIVSKGSYQGVEFINKAILLVGSEPALPLYHKKANPQKMPRIRGSEEYIQKWLKYFENHPEERYISDGDPETITVPKSRAEYIDTDKIKNKEFIVYD